jgi:precorrin-6A/cobalt-precorrin-6A reductase
MPNKKNIMIMAGTKDATNIIKKLSEIDGVNILATTTTEYGADIAKSSGADKIISRALKEEEIIETIRNNNIQFLIDATHPFAATATCNAIKAAEITGIKYIRFERPQIELPESNLIHKVFSFEEAALKSLELSKGNILHLAGVSTLTPIVEKIDSSRLFTRVLPSLDSIGKCLDLGLKQENIIAMQGTFSKKFNKVLMEEYGIYLIITKESGVTGGTPNKINAALDLGIDTVIVVRPEIKELENQIIFNDIDEICNTLLK